MIVSKRTAQSRQCVLLVEQAVESPRPLPTGGVCRNVSQCGKPTESGLLMVIIILPTPIKFKKRKYDRMATNMYIRSDNIEWGSGSPSPFKYQLPNIRVGSLVNK